MDDRPLDGHVGIVSGAAGGLGGAFVRALRDAGAHVVGFDRRPGADLVADAAAPDDVRGVITHALERFGRIDVAISNAGSFVATSPLEPWDEAVGNFDHMIADNLRSVFLLGRAVAPAMVAARSGNIINVSTDHTHRAPGVPSGGGPRMDAYDAAKWGIRGLTESWAAALAPHGVRVNELCMGATDGEFLRAFMGDRATPEMRATWLDPGDIARLAVDLICEGPSGRTGQRIGIWTGHPVRLPPRALRDERAT